MRMETNNSYLRKVEACALQHRHDALSILTHGVQRKEFTRGRHFRDGDENHRICRKSGRIITTRTARKKCLLNPLREALFVMYVQRATKCTRKCVRRPFSTKGNGRRRGRGEPCVGVVVRSVRMTKLTTKFANRLLLLVETSYFYFSYSLSIS